MAINRRKALMRLAAIAIGLAPLVLFELILVCGGWGRPSDSADPFVGFRNTRPLFVLEASKQRYEIPEGRQLCFRPETFAATKAEHEYRIFCLGGSTVQGRPYAIETSFTTWLELSLQAADPTRDWQVVNCGGISYASYRLVPILDEVLQYEPDLIILYTGHNEFLEDRSYKAIKQRSELLNMALEAASRFRTFNVARSAYLHDSQSDEPDRELLPEEVQARLDYRGGLDKYRRDPQWHAGVVRHFQLNLQRMISRCKLAGVPLWLVDPVCNLRTCPPFKSAHRDQLSAAEREEWNRLRQAASESYRTDMAAALGLLKQASTIDDQHAGLWYDLAKCHEAVGQFDQAAQAYRSARDHDICPLRMVEPLHEVLREVADKTHSTVIPVREMFEQHCEHGIPGGFLLVDHVHPSITGHRMVAELMMNQMFAHKIVTPVVDWESVRDESYQEHTAALGDKYYIEGQRRLKGLQSWASGRATKLPVEEAIHSDLAEPH